MGARERSARAAHDPGLAFFYGGMVRSKSVLNMLMMNFIALGRRRHRCGFCYGFSFVLRQRHQRRGPSRRLRVHRAGEHRGPARRVRRGGNPDTGTAARWPGPDAIPVLAFCMFQLMFAVITPALISGAIADRVEVLELDAVRRAVGDDRLLPGRALGVLVRRVRRRDAVGGWIANANKLGALDFAGGTAVHINAGAAGLALAHRARQAPRLAEGADAAAQPAARAARRRPAVVRLVRLQRRLGARRAGDLAGVAFINTHDRHRAAALLGWLVVEQIRDGKPTTLGAASGAVAGLVAITPACRLRQPRSARSSIGLVAGARLRARGRPEVPASASTTRSTSSASTSSAASSAPC